MTFAKLFSKTFPEPVVLVIKSPQLPPRAEICRSYRPARPPRRGPSNQSLSIDFDYVGGGRVARSNNLVEGGNGDFYLAHTVGLRCLWCRSKAAAVVTREHRKMDELTAKERAKIRTYRWHRLPPNESCCCASGDPQRVLSDGPAAQLA